MKESLKFVSSLVSDEFHIGLLKMNIAAHRTALSIQQGFAAANKKLEASTSQMSGSVAAQFLTVAAAGRGLFEIAKAGDTVAQSLARIGAVTGDVQGTTDVLAQLRGVISQTGGDLRETVGQFTRFTIAGKQIGATNDEVVRLIELVQKAGIVSGSSTQELGAAATQLGQALASGRFQGDELRSIMENMPILAEALARNLGVSIGELREMGKEGQLTTDVVFPALLKSADEIKDKFDSMPVGLGRSFGMMKSGISQAAAELDKFIHLSEGLGYFLRALGHLPKGLYNILGQTDYDRKAEMDWEIAKINAPKENIIPGLNTRLDKGGDTRTKADLDSAKERDAELKKMNADAVRQHEQIAETKRKADAEARERLDQMMQVNQRHNQAVRDLQVEALTGEQKLKALEQDRATLRDQLITAGDEEKAQIQEAINQKTIQIMKEKELTKEKWAQNRLDQLKTVHDQQVAKLQGLREDQLAFELMSPDERRAGERERRRVLKAQERIKRREDRDGRDARFGAGQNQNEIKLTKETITALATEIAKIIPM
jgi:tape measure domain-containing protein